MLHSLLIEDTVRRALLEDLGHGHDLTSSLCFPNPKNVKARIFAKTEGFISGADVAQMAFQLIDPDLAVKIETRNGEKAEKGQTILSLKGLETSIMTGERVALNFLSHLSGIATKTNKFVKAVEGTKARICETRKTIPGLRALQKRAVVHGGGFNHRMGLDDGVLIKDNHIAAAGGVGMAIENVLKRASHMSVIEVEVDTLEQLEEALGYKIHAVLLDNMDPETMRKAVHMINGRLKAEASGSVTLEKVRAIAESGVDYISIGALTHTIEPLDFSLEVL